MRRLEFRPYSVSGIHKDPTANTAIGNVAREEKQLLRRKRITEIQKRQTALNELRKSGLITRTEYVERKKALKEEKKRGKK